MSRGVGQSKPVKEQGLHFLPRPRTWEPLVNERLNLVNNVPNNGVVIARGPHSELQTLELPRPRFWHAITHQGSGLVKRSVDLDTLQKGEEKGGEGEGEGTGVG